MDSVLLSVGVGALGLLVWVWWKSRAAFLVQAAQRAYLKGDEAASLAAFARAATVGRLSADATASYAYLALKNDQTDEAESLLLRALSPSRPGRPWSLGDRRLLETYWSLVLWKRGRLDEAIATLEALLVQGYRTGTLYGNLGFFLLEKDDDRATVICREAVEWDPVGKVLLDNQAALHLKRSEWDEALAVSEKLLALNPLFPEAWYGAGLAALRTGNPEEARRRWRRALELPFHALTTVARAEIEAALAALDP